MRKRQLLLVCCVLSQLVLCLPIEYFENPARIQPIVGTDGSLTEISQYDDNYSSFLGMNATDEVIAIPTQTGILFINQTQRSFRVEYGNELFYMNDIAIKDSIAYITSTDAVIVLDISNLKNITVIDTFQHECSKENLVLMEDYAYYISDSENITILDISTPDNVQFRSTYQHNDTISSFEIKQNIIYYISDDDFYVINATNKLSLEEISNIKYFDDTKISSLQIQNEFVYLIYSSLDKIVVMNCTDLQSISLHNELMTSALLTYFLVEEGKAYLIKSDEELGIFDFTNSSFGESLAEYTLETAASYFNIIKMDVIGNELYIVANRFLQILDISNYENIILNEEINMGGVSFDVGVIGRVAIIAEYFEGLELIDISNISDPKEIQQYEYPSCLKIECLNDYCYFSSDNFGGVKIARLVGGTILQEISTIGSDNAVSYFEIVFPRIYCRTFEGTFVYDIKHPENPVLIGTITDSYLQEFKIVNNKFLTVLDEEGKSFLTIIDVEDVNNPTVLGSIEINNYTNGLEVYEEIAYVGVEGGVAIIDISNPNELTILSQFLKEEYEGINSLYSTGNYLCWNSFSGVIILDVTDPKTPKEKAYFYDGGTALNTECYGNYLLVADGLDNLEILEASFNLVDEAEKSKILIYILVPIGSVVVIGGITVVIVKIRKVRRMEKG